jgi:hypothetical protein
MRVCAEGEEGGETVNGGRVRCACSAHDYRKNVDFGTLLVLSSGIGKGVVSIANHLCGVGEVVVCAVFPFPYLPLSF